MRWLPCPGLSSCSSRSRPTLPGRVELLQRYSLVTPSSARSQRGDTLYAVGSFAGRLLLGEPWESREGARLRPPLPCPLFVEENGKSTSSISVALPAENVLQGAVSLFEKSGGCSPLPPPPPSLGGGVWVRQGVEMVSTHGGILIRKALVTLCAEYIFFPSSSCLPSPHVNPHTEYTTPLEGALPP